MTPRLQHTRRVGLFWVLSLNSQLWTGRVLAQATDGLSVFMDWTVTTYFEVVTPAGRPGSVDDEVTLRAIKPEITPTAPTLSTGDYKENGVSVLTVFVSSGAVPETALRPTGPTPTLSVRTIYYEPVTYTAPKSCATPFTFITLGSLDVPEALYERLTPTRVVSQGHIYETAYLSAGSIPVITYDFEDQTWRNYISRCQKPPEPAGSSCDLNSLVLGCVSVRTYVVYIAALLPGLFVLGFAESYLWFRQMMLGRAALRVGTMCWILISLWMICLTRISRSRRSEERPALRSQWSGMRFREKIRIWFKYGFRWRYPAELLGNPDAGPVLGADSAPGAAQQQQSAESGNKKIPVFAADA